VAATNSIEKSNTSGFKLIIVDSELSQGKSKWLIVLIVGCIDMEILFQNGINSFYLAIGFKVNML
jgi:hypothetical protein